jgi:hypothetical protein
MACTYESITEFERFADLKTLEKALGRVDRYLYTIRGLNVETRGEFTSDAQARHMGELRQAYQTESTKAALKKKGFFVSETRTANGIKLTVRA